MSNPSIVFIQKYHQYFSDNFKNTKTYKQNPKAYDLYMKTSSFYRCKDYTNIANYLSRNEACDKTQIDTAIELKKIQRDISTYMGQRIGSTGLFNEFGDITTKEMKQIKKELNEIKTNVYECVISFTPEFSKENVDTKLQAYNLLKTVLPKYFKSKNMKNENVGWFAAYHTNTDNRHIHLIFYEKTPTNINSKNQPINIEFKKEDFANMKTMIEMNTKPVIYEYEKKRDPILNEAETYILNNPKNEDIINLKQVLQKSKTKQFNRLTNENKKIVIDFVNKLIDNCPNFKLVLDEYYASLKMTQNSIYAIYKENNVSEKYIPYELKNFVNNRVEDLNNRLYNKIFKTIKTFLPMSKKEKPKSFYDQLQFNKEKVSNKADIKKENNHNIYETIYQYNSAILKETWAKNVKHIDTIDLNEVLEAEKEVDPNYYQVHDTIWNNVNLNLQHTNKITLSEVEVAESRLTPYRNVSDLDKYATNIAKPIVRQNYRDTFNIFSSLLSNLDRNYSKGSLDASSALWNEAERREWEEKKKKKKKEHDENIIF